MRVSVLGTITLPGTRRSVGHARSFLRDLVPDGHPARDDLVTAGSETVCNAITHTDSGKGGWVTVTLLDVHGRYRLEVQDDGAAGARPHVVPECGGESGRGMRIVEAVSEEWGFRAAGDRTVVWAEFPRVVRLGAAPRPEP